MHRDCERRQDAAATAVKPDSGPPKVVQGAADNQGGTTLKIRSESTTKHSPIVPGGSRIVVFCWVSAVVLGALYFWNFRNVLDTDEISYLDIADAYSRGDWTNAINSQWSPLYSWVLGGGMALLRPSPKWEFLFMCLVAFPV